MNPYSPIPDYLDEFDTIGQVCMSAIHFYFMFLEHEQRDLITDKQLARKIVESIK